VPPLIETDTGRNPAVRAGDGTAAAVLRAGYICVRLVGVREADEAEVVVDEQGSARAYVSLYEGLNAMNCMARCCCFGDDDVATELDEGDEANV
jgi:hypothetical protein